MTDIHHDGKIEIATGRSRKEMAWKNKEVLWSELVGKLSATHRTAETYQEYIASKKPRQDEIKDIGGFVGGYLSKGRRKPENVVHRQLITLDLDYAKADMWFDFTLLYDCAACIYSTHKHSPAAPRLRLVLPLDRTVFSDEYIAIARRIAGNIGIEDFDHTGFQPSRLMYWPSTSKDGQYVFEFQDGPWLNADAVLSTYRDWKDSSEWPVSERNHNVIQRAIKKQGDPLEKPGIVGAFCRTYSISEAIETFLADAYEPCDVESRYTYKEGSTAAGLITYDDKFAYSHHGTDPVSGKLCNAFDLVRLHKFGLKDDDVREGTPGNKLPSYVAMQDFVTKDPDVRKRIVTEKDRRTYEDFEEILPEELQTGSDQPRKPADDSWKSKLDMDRKGNILSTIDNILLILENDSELKARIAYDDFEKCEVAIKHLPWRKVSGLSRRLTDKDDSSIRHHLEKHYGISNIAKTKDAMEVLAIKTSFHPVRDYLQSVKWDGVKRVDTLLIDFLGALDSGYTRTVIRKILVAAVARIFDPGVKFDHVLVLVGRQGLKKSTLVAKLGREWFSDSFTTIEGKVAFEQLQGVWLVEIAELAALAKADVEKIKGFITKRDDRYRVAFGKRTEKFPRQCVFFATTNKRDFLKDSTGDRRYWPVLVNETKPSKDVFKHFTDALIDQIWAEAVYLYKHGETIYLPEDMVEIATEIQKEHTEEHPWTGLIETFLDKKLPPEWDKWNLYKRKNWFRDEGDEDSMQPTGQHFRDRVCVQEIWDEVIDTKRTAIDAFSATAIRSIMRNIDGWTEQIKPMRYGIYGVQRKGFIRTEMPKELLENSSEITDEI